MAAARDGPGPSLGVSASDDGRMPPPQKKLRLVKPAYAGRHLSTPGRLQTRDLDVHAWYAALMKFTARLATLSDAALSRTPRSDTAWSIAARFGKRLSRGSGVALAAAILLGGCDEDASHEREPNETASSATASNEATSDAGSIFEQSSAVSNAVTRASGETFSTAAAAFSDASVNVPAPDASGDAGHGDAGHGATAHDAATGSLEDGAASAWDAGEARSRTLEQIRAEYRNWQPFTLEPQNISAAIFSLCRSPSAAETAFVESVHGDELYLWDWLNPSAERAAVDFAASANGGAPPSEPTEQPPSNAGLEFDVGATIVKEKLLRGESGYELAALGIMVKREQGFDPETGDWEFGYWEPSTGMLSGPTENAACGPCHAQSSTDYVYLDQSWRLPATP